MTLLAAMDEQGFAQFASVANLAYRARVTQEEGEAAVQCLESPDSNSSDPDNEGRRIERVHGGWVVLNAGKYRDIVTRAVAQEKTRLRVAKFREAKRALRYVTQKKRDVTSSNGGVTQVKRDETPSEADQKQKQLHPNLAPAKPPRERNLVLDSLAAVDGSDPLQVTKGAWSGIARALSDIKAVTPDVTPDEISRRAANYRLHHRDATISPLALAKHWAKCDHPPANSRQSSLLLDADAVARRNSF